MNIQIISENAIKVFFNTHGECSKSELKYISSQIHKLRHILSQSHSDDIIDVIPSYTTLTILVDFPRILPQQIVSQIEHDFLSSVTSQQDLKVGTKTHTLPIYYGEEVALDLKKIAEQNSLTCEQAINLHSQQRYTVYAIGFTPGFPYLGFVDQKLATPRLSSPRTKVAAGSVGIAENQTGIYPQASPGGWNIIGHCPLKFFDQKTHPPSMLKVGDEVVFRRIGRTEFEQLSTKLNQDEHRR